MGEFLVIIAELSAAADILKVLGDPELLHWEWGPHHLDVAARWLPKKGFKLLPKFFDKDYRPGTVGDEGDNLIRSVGGCYLRPEGGGREAIMPMWCSTILELPQMREELKRILEGNVLDMNFEEEIARELKEIFGEAHYEVDKQALEDDNETLRDLAKIITKLIDCIDQIKIDRKGKFKPPIVYFEFYIPRG